MPDNRSIIVIDGTKAKFVDDVATTLREDGKGKAADRFEKDVTGFPPATWGTLIEAAEAEGIQVDVDEIKPSV